MAVETLGAILPAQQQAATVALGTRAATLRAAIFGCTGTALMSLGALGVGWLPVQASSSSVVQLLQSSAFGTFAAGAFVVVGVLFLLFAWLQLGRDMARGFVPELKQQWLLLAAWCAPLLASAPLFSRDVYSYVAQGKLMIAGLNPYAFGTSSLPMWRSDGVDPLWADSPTPYGQTFMLLARLVADNPGENPYFGAIAFRVLALGGVAMLAWAIPILAKNWGVEPSKALWLGVLNPLVILHFVSGAHNDAIMVGLIAAGLALVVRNQPIVGLVLVALAGTIKPVGLLALPFVALVWVGTDAPRREIAKKWLISAAVAIGILFVLGWLTNTGFGWLQALHEPSEVRTWLSPATAVGTMLGELLQFVGLNVLDAVVTIVRLISVAVGLLLIARLFLRPQSRSPIMGLAIAFLLVVATGPVVQPWYLLWSLPFFAACVLTKFQTRLMVLASVGFCLLAVISHFFDGHNYIPVS